MLLFVLADCGVLLQGQGDIIETVEEALPTKFFDVEVEFESFLVMDRFRLEVDRQSVDATICLFEQLVDLRWGEDDGQDTVLETIVEEDVGEALGDDNTKTVIFQRPDGVFTAGTAAEVPSRDQDAGTGRVRLVQLEIRIVVSLVVVAPVVEQEVLETVAFDPFEELFGNNLIGIDVGSVHSDDDTFVFGKCLHEKRLVSCVAWLWWILGDRQVLQAW